MKVENAQRAVTEHKGKLQNKEQDLANAQHKKVAGDHERHRHTETLHAQQANATSAHAASQTAPTTTAPATTTNIAQEQPIGASYQAPAVGAH